MQRAFTLVFAIGGMAAGLAGVLAGAYYGTIDPVRGTSMLIFAFIVVVIGGLGSVDRLGGRRGGRRRCCSSSSTTTRAAGVGDFAVVLLLAVVLLIRPGGLRERST